MSEVLFHLFVWIASPAAVVATAVYAVARKELFLGAFASASILLGCAAIAVWMFDGHLLIYQLIYTALIAVPGLLLIASVASATVRFSRLLLRRFQLKSTAEHVL